MFGQQQAALNLLFCAASPEVEAALKRRCGLWPSSRDLRKPCFVQFHGAE